MSEHHPGIEELAQIKEDIPALVRAVSLLTAENAELRELLEMPTANVVPLRPDEHWRQCRNGRRSSWRPMVSGATEGSPRVIVRQNSGMPQPVPADLLEIAEALVPDAALASARLAEHGNMHHVVLFPGIAAVRISKRPSAAAELPRRVEILRAVAAAGLPFAVPEPLTAVATFGERAAVAISWIDGEGLPEGNGDPAAFGLLLEAVGKVEISPELEAVLHRPRRYADGLGWADILNDEIVPRLPAKWRDGVRQRLDTLLALEEVPARLVHGDLGGSNFHFGEDGKLTGVLDWDMAILSDPAIDAALVAAWHGWDVLRAATDEETYRRAWAWNDAVGVGHLHPVFAGKPLSRVDGLVRSVIAWLEERG
ncbi:aminoglycoside phosphotransferase family protein [Streptosporangium canum]|nr:aminoglycoside phosphotransferase family protein [Streptosporangium canum]